MSQEETNLAGADRIELEGAAGRIGDHGDRRVLLRGLQIRIGKVRQALEDREVGQRSDDAAGHDDGLAADLVRQRTEDHKERRTEDQRAGNQQIGGLRLHLECLRDEEERVELAGVPDHGLTGGTAEQRHDHDLEVVPACEGLGQRRLGSLALFLHAQEDRRLVELHADINRDHQQQDGEQEGNAPAPNIEVLAEQFAAAKDDQQRHEQAQRCGGLNPAGEQTALAVRRMLSHIGGSTTVLTAERQAPAAGAARSG